MTAHRCCPGCGAELTADGGKFCGCIGPFTAEHVDPMHLRPYVDLPEPEDQGSQTPDLEPFARCGQGETAELPVLRPYEEEPDGSVAPAAPVSFAASASASASAAYGDDGAPEARPVPRGGSRHRRKGRGADADDYGRGEGTAKRRLPAKAALAAAGVVAALGAGLLTAQMVTDGDGGGDDRGFSTDDNALPDISGGPTEGPSRTADGKHGKHAKTPSARPTSRAGSDTPRADRDTGRAPAPTPTSSSAAPGTPSGSDSNGNGHDGGEGGGGDHGGERPRPPQSPTQPGGKTLRAGDSGPEVAELQRRLKQAGALVESVPVDGVYSQLVELAVAEYQVRNGVRGDDSGEYGPNTRRALESETSG
jgi:putative peptidoglycan binding protein